jgi:hypothetical protein
MDTLVDTRTQLDDDNSFRLSDHDKSQLTDALRETCAEPFDIRSTRYGQIFASSMIPVDAIQHALWTSGRPYFVLRNLPHDLLAPDWQLGETPIASRVLLGVLGCLGLHPFGYRQEKKGAILHDMYPIPGAEETFSNAGRVPFVLHTENPYLPRVARPTVLLLLALNNDSDTATQLVCAEDLVPKLSDQHDEALRQPIFSFRQSQSFELNGYYVHATKTPVLRKFNGGDEFRWSITTSTTDPVGQQAIVEFPKIAQREAMDIVLKPGELLIFNNWRCLHGRGAVEGKRWIKRVYGTDDDSLIGKDGLIDVWGALANPDVDHSF